MPSLKLVNCFLCLLFFSNVLFASKLVVSTDIGFDPVDNTNYLQYAIEGTTEDTIIIDNVGQDWYAGPLRVERNNLTIIFEEGVVLRALPNVFDIYQPFFRIVDKNSISIIGYGATIMMNRQEYANLADSEYRHGFNLGSSTDILIEGLTIMETGGDGILISKSFQPNSQKNYSEDILIKNCKLTRNYRQGISIVSAKNVTILNCELSETSGTLPEAGIDIEPDNPEEIIENILIKGCRIFNNYGNAIQFAFWLQDDDSQDISVLVEDTYMSNNHHPSNEYVYAEIAATDNDGNGVDGSVLFRNCLVENSQWSAVYVAKSVESYDLSFENCVFKDISNDPIAYNSPIFFEVTNYDENVARFGGASFTDCTLVYDEDIPFFDVFGNPNTSDGLGNITGNFFVVNPNAVSYNTAVNPDNVDISFDYYDSFPETEIEIEASQLDYTEQEEAFNLILNRNSIDLLPVAVQFDLAGSATYGTDYDRFGGFSIFPAGSSSLSTSIDINEDNKEEGIEFFNLSLVDDECISLGEQASIDFSLTDMLVNNLNNPVDLQVKVFPNPNQGTIFIEASLDQYDLKLYNEWGVLVREFISNTNSLLTINDLPAGVYFVEIFNKEKNLLSVQKIIKIK